MANGIRIATYDTVAIHLNLSLRHAFKWHFTVADIKTPIIGMDFLSHYGLLVDPRNKRLIVTTNKLSTKRYAATDNAPSVETIFGDSQYYRLLAEFPGFARPPTIGKEKARHDVITHRNHARPASIRADRMGGAPKSGSGGTVKTPIRKEKTSSTVTKQSSSLAHRVHPR